MLHIFANIIDNVGDMEANSVDPDQTAPAGAVWSGSTLLKRLFNTFQQMEKAENFCRDWHVRG